MNYFQLTLTSIVLGAGLLLTACPKGPDTARQGQGADATAPPAAPAASNEPALEAPVIVDAAQVYRDANCQMCHGEKLEGSKRGPALTGLDAWWTLETLAEYLRDPAGYAAGNPRLTEQAKAYPSMMPAPQLDDDSRKALADWLLVGG